MVLPVTVTTREESNNNNVKGLTEHLTKLVKICLVNLFFVGTIIKCRNESESFSFFDNEKVKSSFFLFLSLLQVCFAFIFNFIATYGAPEGLRMRGVKALTVLIIIGHACVALCLNILLALRMNIGEEANPDASPFSWLAVLSTFLSLVSIWWVATFKFSSKVNLGLPFEPSEQDFTHNYSDETMRHNQHVERNLLF